MVLSPDTAIYIAAGLGLVNVGLIGWVAALLKTKGDSTSSMALAVGGRFDAIERNNDALRRTLDDMDRGLRGEISQSARDGMEAAFSRVQQGTEAQANQLAAFRRDVSEGLANVQRATNQIASEVTAAFAELQRSVAEKLAEAETRAADGRAALTRDTTDLVARARQATDEALRNFGEQQRERLVNAETAVRQGTEAIGISSAKTERALIDQREVMTAQLTQGTTQIADRMARELRELTAGMRAGFDQFTAQLRDQQEQLRAKVDGNLSQMREGNEAALERMRQAVDEQLQSALERRLDESFKSVIEQFAQVQQAIGQVQNVTGQIGDLKRLFSNVKARGGWGEAHIQALLDDVLPPGAYQTNLRVGHEAGQIVEFALRMPLRHAGGEVWLPIDAKFPTEDYDRLIQATESGERELEAAARKALERRIREEAKRISSKYINPPHTVEYAVMYLPSEGLYGEIYRIPGLIETLRRSYSIMLMGPSVLPGLLHCIRVGHLTLALEQKAGAIGDVLAAVKAEWGLVGKALDAMARRATTLGKGIQEAQKHNRRVGNALQTVDALEFTEARNILGLSADTAVLDDADDEEPSTALLGDDSPTAYDGREAAE